MHRNLWINIFRVFSFYVDFSCDFTNFMVYICVLLDIMASLNKKTPVTNGRKKVTASAKAKTSVRRTRTKVITAHNGSYLQNPVNTVETVKDTVMPSTTSKDTNDTILALLQEMNKSNKDIVNHIDALERQQSANLTPLVVRQQARVHTNPNMASSAAASLIPQASGATNEGYRSGQNPLLERIEHIAADSNHEIPHPLRSNPLRSSEQNPHHDSIVPSLEALRQNSTLSQAVSRIMATYDGQARMDAMQGKASTVRRSRRYNTTDLIQTPRKPDGRMRDLIVGRARSV